MGKQQENHALSVAAVLGGIVRSCDPVSVVSGDVSLELNDVSVSGREARNCLGTWLHMLV